MCTAHAVVSVLTRSCVNMPAYIYCVTEGSEFHIHSVTVIHFYLKVSSPKNPPDMHHHAIQLSADDLNSITVQCK